MAEDGYVGGTYDDVAFGDDLEEQTLKTIWSKIAWDPATGFRSRTTQIQHFGYREFWVSVHGEAMELTRAEFLDLARTVKALAEKVEEKS